MSDLDLNAPVRPGSIDTKADEVEKFPYEAFEFTSPQVADTCLLTLKSGWDFEIKGDLEVETDLTLVGDADLGGSLTLNATTIAANYTVTDTDGYNVILVNGTYTVSLPTAGDNTGRVLTIVQINASGIATIEGESSQNISGVTPVYLDSQYQRIKIVCTGSEWVIISGNARRIANAEAVTNEYLFTEDNELDYTASFTDAMAAATVTFSELPSNTVAIFAYLYFAEAASGSVRFHWSRSSGGSEELYLQGTWSDGGTNILAGTFWLPTSGNSLYVRSIIADNTSTFKILGYKTL